MRMFSAAAGVPFSCANLVGAGPLAASKNGRKNLFFLFFRQPSRKKAYRGDAYLGRGEAKDGISIFEESRIECLVFVYF